MATKEKTLKKYASFREMKADEYRYWQSVSGDERMRATLEMSMQHYKMKGMATDGDRLQRSVVHIERPQR